MPTNSIGAAQFKAECLRLIDEVGRGGQPLTITKRGKPVAVLSPAISSEKPRSIIGALPVSHFHYDDPFEPATDPMDWEANR